MLIFEFLILIVVVIGVKFNFSLFLFFFGVLIFIVIGVKFSFNLLWLLFLVFFGLGGCVEILFLFGNVLCLIICFNIERIWSLCFLLSCVVFFVLVIKFLRILVVCRFKFISLLVIFSLLLWSMLNVFLKE